MGFRLFHKPRFAAAFVPLLLLALSACSSDIVRSGDLALTQPSLSSQARPAGSLSLALSAEAQKQASDNLKFNHETLLSTVRRALEGNGVLSKQADQPLPTVEIMVTAVRVRSNFSAIMFGFMAGDDHVNADVSVKAPDGKVVQQFTVSSSYALGGLAGGQDETRMSWLYESFAKRVLEELTGTTTS